MVESTFFRKSKDWEYEEECRIILTDTTNEGYRDFPVDSIARVYCGLLMPESQKTFITRAMKSATPSIPVFEAKRVSRSFLLGSEQIE